MVIKIHYSNNDMSRPQSEHFLNQCTSLGTQKIPKKFHESKKHKSAIMFKINFHASDSFQQLLKVTKTLLKLPHCILKTTVSELCVHEIMIKTFF